MLSCKTDDDRLINGWPQTVGVEILGEIYKSAGNAHFASKAIQFSNSVQLSSTSIQ